MARKIIPPIYRYDPTDPDNFEEPVEQEAMRAPRKPKGKHGAIVPRGSPLKYESEYHDKTVYNLRLLGLTVAEIAFTWGITPATFHCWLNEFPSFHASYVAGNETSDAKVAKALFRKAVGYKHDAVKIFCSKEGGLTYAPFIQHYAPDTAAGIFWLTNRQRKNWRVDHGKGDEDEEGGPGLKIVVEGGLPDLED